MAIVFTNLGDSDTPDFTDTVTRIAYTTASWTPPTSGLIFLYVGARVGQPVDTVSGNSLTWVIIGDVTFGVSRMTLVAADATGATTGVTTITLTGSSNWGSGLFGHAAGVDLTGGVLNAFEQSPVNSGAGNVADVGFAAPQHADNRAIMGVLIETTSIGVTPGTGWTGFDELGNNSPSREVFTQVHETDVPATGSASWGPTANWMTMAAELKAEVGGVIPVSQSMVSGWESTQRLVVTPVHGWESLTSVLATSIVAYESLRGLVVPRGVGYESVAAVQQAESAGYESLSSPTGSADVGWESLSAASPVSTNIVAGWESAGVLRVPAVAGWEAGVPVVAVAIAAYESLQTALKTEPAGYEALTGILRVLESGWESRGPLLVMQSAIAGWESRGLVTAQQIAAYESLTGVLTQSQSGYEALARLAVGHVAGWEAAGRVSRDMIAGWEAAGFEVADIIRLISLKMAAGDLAPVSLEAGNLLDLELE